MIAESIRVLIYGMAGIFVVMGVLCTALYVLKRFVSKTSYDNVSDKP